MCISILYALKKLVLSKRKFLLCNKDISVNLYQLNFPSFHFFLNQTEKFYIPLLFHPFNQTQIREIKISSIPPLFYPLYFLPFYFFTPPTKQTLWTMKLSIGETSSHSLRLASKEASCCDISLERKWIITSFLFLFHCDCNESKKNNRTVVRKSQRVITKEALMTMQ